MLFKKKKQTKYAFKNDYLYYVFIFYGIHVKLVNL